MAAQEGPSATQQRQLAQQQQYDGSASARVRLDVEWDEGPKRIIKRTPHEFDFQHRVAKNFIKLSTYSTKAEAVAVATNDAAVKVLLDEAKAKAPSKAAAVAGRKAKKPSKAPRHTKPAASTTASMQLQHGMQGLTVGAGPTPEFEAAVKKTKDVKVVQAEAATDSSVLQQFYDWASDDSGVPGVADIGFIVL